MSLPPHQQSALDQIEKALQAADARLAAMFAAFARAAQARPVPPAGGTARRTALICLVIAGMLGALVLVLSIRATSGDCPGLPSDQAVASAAIRYAACDKSTDAWSKGAR